MMMGRWLRAWTFAGAGLTTWLGGCTGFDPADGPKPLAVEPRYRPAPVRPAVPLTPPAQKFEVTPVSWQQPAPPPRPVEPPKLDVPPGIPGAATLPKLPPDTPETRAERKRILDQLFPELPDLGPDPVADGTPGMRPVALEELQDFARRNSPLIAQAVAEVESARGQWVQAGLYPNPTVGFQGDQMGNLGSAGQIGAVFNQTIVTGGKLRLARSVAFYDYENARLKLRKAEADLARQVRADYSAALVAAENIRVTRLVNVFAEAVYHRQVAQVRSGQSLPYEGLALRAPVGQVRANLAQAQNRYASAWRQLAATLNAPDMPPAPLAGRADEVGPRFRFDALRDRAFATHTDLGMVRNQVAQAESTLVLERRRPIPNLQNNFYYQDDNQANSFQMGVQLAVEVPVWNRNQGAILTAKAALMRLSREGDRVRNDLQRRLADAFERYEAAREQLALYREQILPDLVRAFRGVHQRYETEPNVVNYNDVATAQQNVGSRLAEYLALLNQQWQAAADLMGIVQAERLEELDARPTGGGPDSWPQAGPKTAPPVLPAPTPVPPKN